MKASAVALVLLLVAPVVSSASDVSKLDNMIKQAEKLGPSVFIPTLSAKAKLPCLCHEGSGSAELGFMSYYVPGTLAGRRVTFSCYVPTYDNDTGLVTALTACVEEGIGTFWEVVK